MEVNMENSRHVYLVAICGMGMGSFAGLLKEQGYRVTGSDKNVYPPMSTQLEEMGIKLLQGYNADNLSVRPDLVIVGNTVKKDNPEARAAIDGGIPYMSFPQALGELFLKDRKSLVVAGTHGKTTTSSMVAWMLEVAKKDPGFLIGGILMNFNASYKHGNGEFFVVEGDEYDTAFFDKVPKFLHYRPSSAIITNVEFDHGDIYHNIDEIKTEFRKLIALIPESGKLVACSDYPHLRELLPGARCQVITYGYEGAPEWTVKGIHTQGETGIFTVYHNNEVYGTFELNVPGRHNILNALAAIALLHSQGIEREPMREALRTFSSVKRRQEVRAVIDNVIVIDDFAHHPTKVRETVSAIRFRYPERRIWAVFEPRTNTSRRAFFQKEYTTSFNDADQVVIAEVFNQGMINNDDRFSPERLVGDLNTMGKSAFYIPKADEIVSHVTTNVRSGDIILIMSNGGFDAIHEKFIESLNKVLA